MSDEIILPDALVRKGPDGGRIVLVVLDGLGGLPEPETGRTELEEARTPVLDGLALRASLGLHDPVAPGITSGSGPGHLSLFGYDPVRYRIGRGALSALGADFDLRPGDVAARLNLASFDGEGRVSDRRAGRPSDDEAGRAVGKVREGLSLDDGVEVILIPEKEHRVVLVLRGEGLSPRLEETDPGETGVPPGEPRPLGPEAERTSEIAEEFLRQAREILADEERMHGFLARGWATRERFPTVEERYGLRAAAVAKYPMYRGVAKLVGMTVEGVPESEEETVGVLERQWEDYDLHFLHFKDPDTKGHDGDREGRVAAIERVDGHLGRVVSLEPDVLVVTGDHSTPARWREHSWHPVPFLIASDWARPTASAFSEETCRTGSLGRLHATHLMTLALAHAGRLEKYGA